MSQTTGDEPLSHPVAGRLKRLILKELREILRDRRTIVTLVVMPILIYPLLAIAFQRFLINSITVDEKPQFFIGVNSEMAARILADQLQSGEAILKDTEKPNASTADKRDVTTRKEPLPDVSLEIDPEAMIKRHVADSSLHIAAIYRENVGNRSTRGISRSGQWDLVYRPGSPPSEAALHFVESRLLAYNEAMLHRQFKKLGIDAELPADTIRRPIGFTGAPAFSLAALVPLILVLMTVTGAVYPAIDLTAGERERGTMEALIAAPVPRLSLLFAKYMAVLTVAILTALINLVAMTITANSTGLAASLFGGGMSFGVAIKVLMLLVLFAAFFSAILLAITSYARSFKEAQAYIIPLMLLCLVPGVVCLLPSLEFKNWMAVTPLVNIVMLGRDLLEGSATGGLAIAAVGSTIFYVGAALGLAARIFGTDAILYGSPSTWSDLFRRPREYQLVATLPTAALGLALIFPCTIVLASNLARSPNLSMATRLEAGAAITAAVFGGIPILLSLFGRVRAATGLGIRRPGIGSLIGAAVLGVSLWPIAHETYLLAERVGITTLSGKQFAAATALLEELHALPLALLIITLGIVPAIFEELCFRGFLFGALRTRLSGTATVVASALLFGVFHEILAPGRLLPSTFLGLILGWVRLRSASIWPGIVLHALNNSFLLSLSSYRDELLAAGWGTEEQQHLPVIWYALSFVGIILGSGILFATTRPKNAPTDTVQSPD